MTAIRTDEAGGADVGAPIGRQGPAPGLGQALVLLAALVVLPAAGSACAGHDTAPGDSMDVITTIQIADTRTGSGAEASAGRTVTVHYTGWLYDPQAGDHRGRKFDSSRDRREPFSFRLGAGEVIRGWDTGVAGMKIGGTRVLQIPPDLAYGSQGVPGIIPARAPLVFEVELLDVR
jgi:FKBP-type peptidyl-prolyl cis-trans isomerase FkpA